MRRAFRILILCLAAASGGGCAGFLYYPTQIIYVDVARLKPEPEQCEFKSGRDTIGCWYFKAPPNGQSPARPKAVIALFHGNGQNRSAHFASLYWMLKEGYDLFAFDYPGYGDSTGFPNPENTVASGVEALRFLKRRNPSLPIVVYGQSLGGAVALQTVIEAKNEIAPALVVADSTFLSYRQVARKKLAANWITWPLQPFAYLALSDRYAPIGHLGDLPRVPLVVIDSEADEVVPFVLGERLFAEAPEPKEFWRLKQTRHIDGFGGPEGLELREKFLAKLDKTLVLR